MQVCKEQRVDYPLLVSEKATPNIHEVHMNEVIIT